jgi:hypothetical protein
MSSSEAAVTPIPRRGRIWVILILALGLFGLGYAIVEIATKPPDGEVVRIAGIDEAQELFGGVPQEGERLGSKDAPVSIQVFADMQCGSCREDFLATIPPLTNEYARPGSVKLLLRHYSVAENPLELGFFGAEAAADQGYGWQYTYLFFRNQEEAKKFGIDEDFMASVAGSIGELELPEWEKFLETESGSEGQIERRLESYDELGTDLGIRTGIGMIVNGPHGTRTLQDGPAMPEIRAAIAEVEGEA